MTDSTKANLSYIGLYAVTAVAVVCVVCLRTYGLG